MQLLPDHPLLQPGRHADASRERRGGQSTPAPEVRGLREARLRRGHRQGPSSAREEREGAAEADDDSGAQTAGLEGRADVISGRGQQAG